MTVLISCELFAQFWVKETGLDMLNWGVVCAFYGVCKKALKSDVLIFEKYRITGMIIPKLNPY